MERKEALEEKRKQRNELIAARKKSLEERQQIKQRPLAQQFKGMETKGCNFFYEGEKISEDKAIALVKENPKLNVSMHVNNGEGTVHLSKKGIKTVNGKVEN